MKRVGARKVGGVLAWFPLLLGLWALLSRDGQFQKWPRDGARTPGIQKSAFSADDAVWGRRGQRSRCVPGAGAGTCGFLKSSLFQPFSPFSYSLGVPVRVRVSSLPFALNPPALECKASAEYRSCCLSAGCGHPGPFSFMNRVAVHHWTLSVGLAGWRARGNDPVPVHTILGGGVGGGDRN